MVRVAPQRKSTLFVVATQDLENKITDEKMVLAGISMLRWGHNGVFCMLKRYACNF